MVASENVGSTHPTGHLSIAVKNGQVAVHFFLWSADFTSVAVDTGRVGGQLQWLLRGRNWWLLQQKHMPHASKHPNASKFKSASVPAASQTKPIKAPRLSRQFTLRLYSWTWNRSIPTLLPLISIPFFHDALVDFRLPQFLQLISPHIFRDSSPSGHTFAGSTPT